MIIFGFQIGSWHLEPERRENMMKTAVFLLIDGLPRILEIAYKGGKNMSI